MYTIILNLILICKTNLKVTYPEWLIWKVIFFTTYDTHTRDNDPDGNLTMMERILNTGISDSQ